MTDFLASVRSRAEAELVLAAGADIIDLKEPDNGALGAVEPGVVRECLAAIGGRAPVSATVGDLPMSAETVTRAVAAQSSLGVDVVKLGIVSDGDPEGCFAALRALNIEAKLMLVFFADALPDFDPADAALASGAGGVMLDTAGKQQGSLLDHMALPAIEGFVTRAHQAGLMAGVAGSLRARHVEPLLACRPDVIGFRGALCEQSIRGGKLAPSACADIRALIDAGRERTLEVPFSARPASAMC